ALLAPGSRNGGATRVTVAAAVSLLLAQLRSHCAIVSAQALSLACQQLWPPDSLVTNSDCAGSLRLTSGVAAAYARLISSLRAKYGAVLPCTWQAPQRLVLAILSHSVSLNN